MRWIAVSVIALTLFLGGWISGQRGQEDEAAKFSMLEKRLTEAERKIEMLEKEIASLKFQVKQLREQPFILPRPLYPLFEWRIPEKQQGFGLPKPAPQPFVQPYYYPLERQP